MASEMKWTEQTYRLDEIERKFDLPCVIHVNEGYYSETDAEGFSQGDILSIDSKMVLHKVAANFAKVETASKRRDPDYVELENEILVPLNYKGKLKVLRRIKNYENVRELATDFPRYAKVRENLLVTGGENVPITIQAGTTIELDRIIPGSMNSKEMKPDQLVIQFEHHSGPLVVAVPFPAGGKFRTEQDQNEYTIREAIDRYSLPQHVKFVDNDIKRVYTQDLMEGIENMRTITETLRLNRLVTQNVLVGHYKRLEESETIDTERFRQRTLVVLPTDNPEIREIEVNVLKGVTDDIYEQVFLVRNVSNTRTEEVVDGCLYVDFAMTPGIKIISPEVPRDTDCDDKPPPRPPKPGNLAAPTLHRQVQDLKQSKTQGQDDIDSENLHLIPEPTKPLQDVKIKATAKVHKEKPTIMKRSVSVGSYVTGDYIVPYKPITTFLGHGPVPDLKQSKKQEEDDTDSDDIYVYPEATKTKKKVSSKGQIKKSANLKRSVSLSSGGKGGYQRSSDITASPALGDYVGFSMAEMDFSDLDSGKRSAGKKSAKKLMSNLKGTLGRNFREFKEYMSTKQATMKATTSKTTMAAVEQRSLSPSEAEDSDENPRIYDEIDELNMSSTDSRTLFKDLTNTELVDRLNVCGLQAFANFCKSEKLNGSFFEKMSKETLQKEMNLKGLELTKLILMRDKNWIPT